VCTLFRVLFSSYARLAFSACHRIGDLRWIAGVYSSPRLDKHIRCGCWRRYVESLHWVWMAALLGIWRVIQDYFATPSIMGSHLKIHPLAAIFGVLVGAEIGGIVGIYLAVPMMASFGIIWRSVAQKRTKQGGRPKQSVATGRPLEEGPELLVISCHRRPPVRVSLLLPLVHAATTLLVRRVLTSRMGGWPKKRLYSRLNWLTLS
jgi:hypothetical protein